MAISSAGVGSGLDIVSIVNQLVSAERAPQANRLSRSESATKTTLSALGAFKSALANFSTAVNALKGSSTLLAKVTATSSQKELFTATAAAGTATGSFSVEVIETALAAKIATSPYAGATSVVGNGTVTLHTGSESFSVTLTDGANTLQDLRDKINLSEDNTGVSATILNETGGARLILTSKQTGVANAVTLTSAAAVGGGSFVTTAVVDTARDAEIEIDGFPYISASNTITGAIGGVTLTLLKAQEGTVGTLDLAQDGASATNGLGEFVKTYNAFVNAVAQYTRFDATTKTGGPLMGESVVRSTQQQIRSILGSAVGSGDFTLLAQVGITTQADGTLKIDSAKLDTALKSDPRAVKAMFEGEEGFATRLADALEGVLGDEGRLTSKTKSLQDKLDDISDQRDRLDVRMAMVEQRYRAQFTALDSLLGQLQTTSNYLTQQLGNLPGSSDS